MKQRLLSIGLPVYNGESFLRETLDSILSQTYKNFELIISDNCSTDSTRDICEKYAGKDSRIRYIRQPHNIGALNNFLFVLNVASGYFFMWNAADDVITPMEYLQKLIGKMGNNYDYVFPDIKILRHLENSTSVKETSMHMFSKCSTHLELCVASIRNNAYQVYSVFKKSALIGQTRYLSSCEKMKCYNEGLFVHAITANLKGAFEPSVVKFFRRHSYNMSSNVMLRHHAHDFTHFTLQAVKLWLRAHQLTPWQRLKVLAEIGKIHGKQLCYLAVLILFAILEKHFKSIKYFNFYKNRI